MSDKLLRALMQLFAILGKIDGIGSNSRQIVLDFLQDQLNQELSERYISLYEDFVEKENSEKVRKRASSKPRKRTSVRDSLKILHICSQINEELTQRQKFIVLIRLLEFLIEDSNITKQGEEILDTISTSFNISEGDLSSIKSFVFSPSNLVESNSDLLVISNESEFDKNQKHLFIVDFDGRMYIYHVAASGMYILTYKGENELYLNGQLIKNNKSYVFANGASIRSSKKMKTIYYSDIASIFSAKAIKTKLSFKVDNISFKFRNKQALYPLTFSENSGNLVGIMGASGSGKSTLLNILNGKYPPFTGKITINGIDLTKNPKKLEGIIGYVSQDDLLIDDLTVYENLYLNAELCFGKYDKEFISEKVDKTLIDLGLFEIKDLTVGNPLDKKISGGQRKRLNIALELIREPEILFVDEPTSGLSSRGSLQIMDLLKEQTLKGKLVFTVIHQPSSEIFLMFNNLLLLDNAYPVYYGHPSEALHHFKSVIHHVSSLEGSCIECGSVNSEEIFDIIESKIVDEYGELTNKRKVEPSEWYQKYVEYNATFLEPEKLSEEDLQHTNYKVPHFIKQLKVFIKRDLLSKKANLQYLLLTFLQAPVLALLLGLLIKQYSEGGKYIFRENENIPAYLFMSVVVSLFLGLSLSAQEIFKDRKILKREEFLNLSWLSYLASKCSVLFVISAIQIASYILIGNLVLGINSLNFEFWLILFSASCVANTMGLIISSSFNSEVNIYILVPILLIPQLLLSGVIVKFDKLHPNLSLPTEVPFEGEIMASRWAFEALAVTQFKNNEFEKEFFPLHQIKSEYDYKKNYWINELINTTEKSLSLLENNDNNKLNTNLRLIYNELNKELDSDMIEVLFGSNLNSLIESPSYLKLSRIKSGLQKLNSYYVKRANKVEKEIDKKVYDIRNKLGKDGFLEIRNNNENLQLTHLVKKSDDTDKQVVYDNEIYQKIDPIFQNGKGNLLKASFFSYSKKLFGNSIDTLWANVLVLWVINLIQFIILYFRAVKILIVSFGRLMNKLGLNN